MEQHKEFYRGTFIPVTLMRLFEFRLLSGDEILLLQKIDALQDPKRGGCWASNQWLAAWWGKSDNWVSKTISKFSRMKLVKVTQLGDGNRLIKIDQVGLSSNLQLGLSSKTRLDDNPIKVPLREGDNTTGEKARPVEGVDFLIPPEEIQTKFSGPVIEFANWSRKRGFHIRVPGAKPVYAKGGQAGGWSRHTLLRWEEVYKDFCKIHGEGKVSRTLTRFIRWYDSDNAPTAQTFMAFVDKFDRIAKFVQIEKGRREKSGEDSDELDFPLVRETIINPGKPTKLTNEEHNKLREQVDQYEG